MTDKMRAGLILACLMIISVSPSANVNSVDNPSMICVGLDRPMKMSLNGEWTFQKDPDEKGESEQWFQPRKISERTVTVPLPWQLTDEDLIPYRGTAWYERKFNIPSEYQGKRIAMSFYGVFGIRC